MDSDWVDIGQAISAWTATSRWNQSSVAYVRIDSVVEHDQLATAALIDPSFPTSLGCPSPPRMLLDIGISMQLEGPMISKLRCGMVYVVYGAQAPVQNMVQSIIRIQVPMPSRRAGISRVLGTGLPWQTSQGGGKGIASVAEIFSGGMGGWTQAIWQIPQFKTVIAIDVDEHAAQWFASQQGGVHVGWDGMSDFMQQFRDEIPVLCGDVGTGRGFSSSWMSIARF